jgi:hypothetical protein
MPASTPQNSEEAAYIGFALVDALADLLMKRGIINRGDFFALFETVAKNLGEAPNSTCTRAAEFVRGLRLSKE